MCTCSHPKSTNLNSKQLDFQDLHLLSSLCDETLFVEGAASRAQSIYQHHTGLTIESWGVGRRRFAAYFYHHCHRFPNLICPYIHRPPRPPSSSASAALGLTSKASSSGWCSSSTHPLNDVFSVAAPWQPRRRQCHLRRLGGYGVWSGREREGATGDVVVGGKKETMKWQGGRWVEGRACGVHRLGAIGNVVVGGKKENMKRQGERWEERRAGWVHRPHRVSTWRQSPSDPVKNRFTLCFVEQFIKGALWICLFSIAWNCWCFAPQVKKGNPLMKGENLAFSHIVSGWRVPSQCKCKIRVLH